MALAEQTSLDSIRVLVHSHARLLRDGVARLLDDAAGVRVVARTQRARDLVDATRRFGVDVVVVHVDLLDLDLMLAVTELRRGWPPVKVVAVGTRMDAAQWGTTRRSSIDAFVPASASSDVLLTAIAGYHISPTAARAAHVLTPLSAREQDVLELVGAGLRARDISQRLGITPKTVENHKQRIYAKLGVRNQAHAVSVAVRAGLLRHAVEEAVAVDG